MSILAALALVPSAARHLDAQGHAGHGGESRPSAPATPATTAVASPPGRRISMDDIHRAGGVPPGWRFTLPSGDVARGRQVFVDLECHKCHAVAGESFPATAADAKNVGPELTGMGAHHPAEYFAESIVSPNAVILEGPGFSGPDGRSVMPSYADSLTVPQLVDLVAYLKSLTGDASMAHGATVVERETLAGNYRVRLVYEPPGGGAEAGGHHAGQMDHMGHEGHGGHATAAMAPRGPGQLMAFVTDRESGEPVPYLSVSATLQPRGGAARTVKLAPRLGPRGFHYGARTTVPARTERISVGIGAVTMEVLPPLKGRFARPLRAVLDWETGSR